MTALTWCDRCQHTHAEDGPCMFHCEDCGTGDPTHNEIGHLDFDTEDQRERKELAAAATNVLLVWRLVHLMIGARW